MRLAALEVITTVLWLYFWAIFVYALLGTSRQLAVGPTSAIALMVVLDQFVSRTRIGKAMRATSYDREAAAMMGINAVKGVEIGAGFASVAQKGSEHGDEMTPQGFASNHAGGVLGGISTGQEIVVNMAIKPTSSIAQSRRSVDVHGNQVEVATQGRHDPCVGIRATPIAEAMMAIVLMDHFLRHRAQNAGVASGLPILRNCQP